MRIEVSEIYEAGQWIGWTATDIPVREHRAHVTDAGIEVRTIWTTQQLSREQLADLPHLVEVWRGLRRDLATHTEFDRATWQLDPLDVLLLMRLLAHPLDPNGPSEWARVSMPTGQSYAVVVRLPAGLDAILSGSRIHLAQRLDKRQLHRFLTRPLPQPDLLSLGEDGAEFLVEVATLFAVGHRAAGTSNSPVLAGADRGAP